MFNHFRCLIRAVFACCAVATFLGPSVARAETNVLFIFDASGSMKKPVGDTPRIDLARKSLIETVLAMPSNVRVGLMIYGARRAKDCTDIQLVSPVQANNRDQVVLSMAGLQAKGRNANRRCDRKSPANLFVTFWPRQFDRRANRRDRGV